MSLRSYLFPRTLLVTSSPYNTHIRVNEHMGKLKLLVNGSPQSGTSIDTLWKCAFRQFHIDLLKPKTALVLGLGGGTVLPMLGALSPGIRITCVEIDPIMIDIAKRYFHVGRIPSCRILEGDARSYVAARPSRVDLAVVDVFSGFTIPAFVEDPEFWKDLMGCVVPGGCIVLNYLRELEYKQKADKLLTMLQELVPTTRYCEIENNRFFFLCI